MRFHGKAQLGSLSGSLNSAQLERGELRKTKPGEENQDQGNEIRDVFAPAMLTETADCATLAGLVMT